MRGDPPLHRLADIVLAESTPHARGSTVFFRVFLDLCWVYPACAGIHLSNARSYLMSVRLPRMRGDPPFALLVRNDGVTSTPHARGSTLDHIERILEEIVYPACAGIHHRQGVSVSEPGRLPRMRGDPPFLDHCQERRQQSTPHARGSTRLRIAIIPPPKVYPACAGIHP